MEKTDSFFSELKERLDTLPIVDQAYALEQVGGDASVAQELFVMLAQWLPGVQDIVERAEDRKDYQTIKDYTHQIKGATAYCGTKRLNAMATAADDAIANSETETIYQHVQLLCHEMNLIIQHHEQTYVASGLMSESDADNAVEATYDTENKEE